jgi:hypothetical protein
MDSFRLVRLRVVIGTGAVGGLIAILCLFLNRWLIDSLALDVTSYTRYFGPALEESLKAGCVLLLIKSRRAAFLVDSAILGFAVGAGFAVVENVYYAQTLVEAHVMLWVIRGFGTACIHGTATAIFSIMATSWLQGGDRPFHTAVWVPLAAAVALHALFNHFVLSPFLTTIWIVILLPLLTLFVYGRGERALRAWLGTGIDKEMELLEELMRGEIGQTHAGRYLQTLKSRFPGEVVADMFCLLRLHLELSIGAKGLLLLRGHGLATKSDPEIRARLAELKYLERSLGRTGRLAVQPILSLSRRDLWQLYLLNRF